VLVDPQSPVESPGWWFQKLLPELVARRRSYDVLDAYYRGDPPLPWGPENCKDVFRKFQRKARLNLASVIVEAVRHRQVPLGFRTGADGDEYGDDAAWGIWQGNDFDAEWKVLNRAKLSMGDAYTIVGPPSDDGIPTISAEDPRQVITASEPGNRRRARVGLKVFKDEWTAELHAYLYLPGVVYRLRHAEIPDGVLWPVSDWSWVDDGQSLPLQVVPVVHFGNRVDLFGRSLGEFEDVIDSLDRVNLMLLQRMTVAVMQAFRQRAVKGNLPETDATGDAIDWGSIFTADPGAVWSLPAGVDLWESGGVDLTPLLESVKADVRDILATTSTPLFYMFPDAANGSAEGASLQRESLVFKTQDRNDETSDPIEQTMALAFQFAGDVERGSRRDMEVIWAPPERFSLAERSSAATQAGAAGVPWETVMAEFFQFTPQQVARMAAQRANDVLLLPPAGS